MSAIKKRKHQIVDSDDEPEVIIASSDEDVKPRKKSSKSESQKRKKRAAIIDSDEGDNSDNAVSINDIKKKAKSKAKKLSRGDDSEDEAKPAKASKTPPPPKQSNNILNYFKPTVKKPDDKEKKDSFTQVKERKEVTDEFAITTLKGKTKVSTESPKPKESTKATTSTTKAFDDVPKVPKKSDDDKNRKVSSKDEKSHSSKSKESSKIDYPKDNFQSTKVKVESPKSKMEASTSKNEPTISKHLSPTKSPKKQIVKAVESKRELPKIPVPEALPRIEEAKRISDLWVDKYRPSNTSSVIGQQGDRSPLRKLLNWLRNWHQNLEKKPGFGKWASDDGSGFRAALLSGPPGIGKTTTAQLVCKELGYDFLELNASDARNKKSLQEDVRELLANTKLTNFFKPATDKSGKSTASDQKLTAKHCVIMDEVDGMAGNEDRGGVAELIQLIKKTKVPIICICNDRGDQKMRSLVNYCFDLKFPKPRIDQIKGPLLSIAYKEKIQISPNVLNDLIASSNYDIRQCIHNLSLLGAGHTSVSEMINSNQNAKPIKDVKLGPFEAIKKVFCTGEEYARMSFADKSDLFFADYGIMPLFVYENYNSINLSSKEPSTAKQLKRMMKAIDAISFGEVVEKEVRTNQNWSLLPLQAAFSTVMPGAYMRSANGLGFPGFPQYMGKLSTTNKNHRLVDELVSHMTLSVTGTRTSFSLDYLQPLKDSLVNPLIDTDKGGVSSVLDLMESYSLTKDNMDSILELGLWSGQEDPMKKVDSKTKAALTRAYNKKDFALPYATDNDTRMVTKRGAKGKGGKKGKASAIAQDSEDSDQADVSEDEIMDFY